MLEKLKKHNTYCETLKLKIKQVVLGDSTTYSWSVLGVLPRVGAWTYSSFNKGKAWTQSSFDEGKARGIVFVA